MPKMKSNRGAAKRFRVTKKSPKRKRNLRKEKIVTKADEKRVHKMILQ